MSRERKTIDDQDQLWIGMKPVRPGTYDMVQKKGSKFRLRFTKVVWQDGRFQDKWKTVYEPVFISYKPRTQYVDSLVSNPQAVLTWKELKVCPLLSLDKPCPNLLNQFQDKVDQISLSIYTYFMDKVYDQKTIEEKWYTFWEENGYFKSDPDSDKPSYSLLMPPPNLTGELHLGHAMEHSIMDAIARFKRMQGFNVLLLPGVDHAGIQFEGTLNKLLSKEGISREKMGREAWLKRAGQFKDEMYASFHQTWKAFGVTADWS